LRSCERRHDHRVLHHRADLDDWLLANEGPGGDHVSAFEAAAASAVKPVVLEKPRRRRPKFADTWWRHVVGVLACLFALFPVWFVASAAFNRDQSVSGTSYFPVHFTLHNFGGLLHNKVKDTGSGSYVDTPCLLWLGNSIFVALVAAFFTVLIASLAAYAFSRFRFRGRRFGMLALLLIQMFP